MIERCIFGCSYRSLKTGKLWLLTGDNFHSFSRVQILGNSGDTYPDDWQMLEDLSYLD